MGIFDWTYKLMRWGLAGIFIYAGSLKLLEPATFAVLIEAYGIVPEGLLMPVSIALPALEVAAGIGLLFDLKGSLAVIAGLLGLFILMTGIAAPALAFLGNKFEKELETETGAVKLLREVQHGGYGVVATAELKKWIDSGKNMVIVDTMPYEDSYKKQHVPGAVQFLFPIPDMKQWDVKETGGKTQEDFVKLLGNDKDKLIVIYCGFVKCTRSHNGASWAVKLGYKNVYRYPGGIFAWKGAGYPEEKTE